LFWPVLRAYLPSFGEFGVEFGHDGEEIADEAVIGDLEDRRLLVLVDGDDDLRILHAGEMLDRAGDADRDVEVGRHDLAGLADLPVIGGIAGIDRGARGAHGRAELVGDGLDHLGEVLRGASARPPEMMILAEASSGRSDLATSSPLKLDRPGLPAAVTASTAAEPPVAGSPGRRRCGWSSPSWRRRLHGLDGVAGIDRPLEGVGRDDLR
jgi:hypothetical protein